ncbi:hypothetical protein NPIL_529361 [Nephila pilipes]|uniref:Uncharacterized protein n=1 Tax=Nephila pilipes TaxID=299642 RepID=A0A8X6NQ97_NEPPI|nr:hypothetical protein NPIL_529361 [Nephila pilipes]
MGKTTYFYCHRNGFYKAKGHKKRTIKMGGSNKMNGNCPSNMKVCEDIENQVSVEFTKTHLGHGSDLGRMRITREEKARKLENKILSVHSPLTAEEEMVICEDRKILEKEAVVENLKVTTTRKKISMEEFQKKCTELLTKKLINKTSSEHYDDVLNFLENALDLHFPLKQIKQLY